MGSGVEVVGEPGDDGFYVGEVVEVIAVDHLQADEAKAEHLGDDGDEQLTVPAIRKTAATACKCMSAVS